MLLFIFTLTVLIDWLVFRIKDGYKLELQKPETMQLVGSTKTFTDKTKNG